MKRFFISCVFAITALSTTWLMADDVATGEPVASATLSVTSPAPAIEIEHWISADLAPVDQFESDKIYVIEFWATWCMPCIGTMPHLVELQEKHAADGVQIVSVSNEPLETVEEFLKTEVRGSKEGQTYRELTSAYRLTTDPDRSVHQAYLEAAGVGVIPTAFVVGKSGNIEWIGHPKDIEQPLESLIAGTWDAEAFRVEWEESQRLKELEKRLKQLVAEGNLETAVKVLDNEYGEDSVARDSMRESLMQLNMVTAARAEDLEKTVAIAEELFARYQDDPKQLANFSNQLRTANRVLTLPKSLLENTAARLTEMTEQNTEKPVSSVYMALVLLQMDLGDKEKATQALSKIKEIADKEKAENSAKE